MPLISGLDLSNSRSTPAADDSVGRSKASPADHNISAKPQKGNNVPIAGTDGDAVAPCQENLRSAASSSGDAFLFTSCNKRIAASTSDCEVDTRDVFDSGRFFSVAVELRLLRTKDRNAECDLECVREFDLETAAERRPRPSATGSASNTSCSDQIPDPASLLMGENASLICCRLFSFKSV
jgi:hypothetical protein